MTKKFTALITREEKWNVARCVELDVVSQGKSLLEFFRWRVFRWCGKGAAISAFKREEADYNLSYMFSKLSAKIKAYLKKKGYL